MNDSVPTVEERRQQYREGMIEDILAIAREMMQADGVAALSFNAIARRLGMKPPSLYTYFDSKNAIYDELFRRGFIAFGQQMDAVMVQSGPLHEKVQGTMERAMATYMRFAQENADLYQLMFQRPVPGFEPSEESMAVSLARLEQVRRQFAEVLQSDELTVELPVDEARDLYIALQHGLTELHLANDPELPVGEGRFGKLIPEAVQLILDAWRTAE